MSGIRTSFIKTTRTDKTSTFAGGLTINQSLTFGDAAVDTITINGLATVATNQKIQFRDTGIYINSGSDGKLTISSDGTGTDDITISGTTVYDDGVDIGLSGTPVTLATYAAHGLEIYTTCASTDGANSVRPIYMTSTMTGAGGVGGRAEFYMTTNVALGGWSNALKGFVEYGATGSTTGLGSAFVAELSLSAGTTSGTYAPLEVELNIPSGASLGTLTSMAHFSAQGADITTFDTSGYVINIQGLSAGANNTFRTGLTAATINAATTAALRIRVGGTNYFIPLATATA